ncbi:PH domain-containing protein [Shouchella shacheensis]|uniref:PH domain-containing protein n=1 Tax=Shouchella shacheensis TaxID=1649580 RepID=UPI000740000E|nr:PH domain-containing protein [Shouchella shacheensis]
MSELKRQHPAAILINTVSTLKSFILPFVIIFFLNDLNWMFFSALAGIFVLLVLTAVLSWFKYRYQVNEGELYVEQGIFIKKKRYIHRKRVQSINVNAGVLQRLFGLVKVKVDTAGGGEEAEAELVAVTRDGADVIRAELLKKATEPPDTSEEAGDEEGRVAEEEAEEAPLHTWRLGKKRLLYAALTSSGLGLVISAVLAVLSQAGQFIPDSFYEETAELLVGLGVLLLIVVVIGVLLISWLISCLITVITYGNFKIDRYPREMVVARGLLERRELTLQHKRITAVRMIRNVLRQPFGFVSIYVETAGGGNAQEQGSTLLVPLIHKRDLPAFFEETLPEFAFEREMMSAPGRAAKRFFIRNLILPVLLTGVAIYFFGTLGALAAIFIVLLALLAYLQYKDAGAGFNEQHVWLRYRTLSQTVVVTPRQKVQAATRSTSFLQKYLALSSFEVNVQSSLAGRSFTVHDLADETGDALLAWYSRDGTRS